MFKQALYTYWKSLHPRNLKYIVEKRWITFVLVFVLLPDFSEIKQYGIGAFYPFTIFLPVALMKMSNLVRKINIPKVLFLAPMQEKERKLYIKYLIAIKIGVSMMVGICIQLVWRMFYSFSATDILICMFAYLSYGIADYFCVEGTLVDGTRIEHGVRQMDGTITFSSCNLLVAMGVIITCMGFMPLSISSEPVPIIFEVPTQIVSIGLMLIGDIIIIIRQSRDMINTVCYFEPHVQPMK